MRFLLSQFKLPTRFNPLSIFILLFIVIPVVPVHAEQWQKLDVHGYVNDFAGVLNPATVEKLTQLSTEIDQKAKAQVAVVTVKTLEDDAPEDFANHLFQKWGVGYKGTDRGVLVLVATDDHKYWTEVGYGLEPILPDGKVGRFGRNMVPLLRQGNYNDAILQMAGEIAQVIALDSHVSLDGLAGFHAATAERQPTQLTGGQIILLIIVFLIVAPFLFKFLGPWFLLSLLTGGGGRGNDGWGGGGFGGGGGGGGFGGFGGGSSGGGGAGGSW